MGQVQEEKREVVTSIVYHGVREVVFHHIERSVIDNFFLMPYNAADKIETFLSIFLSSHCKSFAFNIDGYRKTLSIDRVVKIKNGPTLYRFRYQNKNRNCSTYYERLVTREAIIELYHDCEEFKHYR